MDGTVEDVVELSTLTRFSRFSALLTEGQEGLKDHSKNQGAKTCRKLFGLHVTYIIN